MENFLSLLQVLSILHFADCFSISGFLNTYDTCKYFNKKLFLEEGITKYGTNGFFPDHEDLDVQFFVPLTEDFDFDSFFLPEHDWEKEFLDSSGITSAPGKNIYGYFYSRKSAHVYTPKVSPNIFFALERDFYERVFLRSLAKFRISFLVESERPFSRKYLNYLYHLLPHLGGPVKTVDFIGINMIGEESDFFTYQEEILEFLEECENCGMVYMNLQVINGSYLPPAKGKYYDTTQVRTSVVTPYPPVGAFHELLNNIYMKLQCLFITFADDLKREIFRLSEIRSSDMELFENIQTSIDLLLSQVEASQSFREVFSILKESDIQEYVSYNHLRLHGIYEFLNYLDYISEAFQLDLSFNSKDQNFPFEELKSDVDKLLEWQNYINQIFDLFIDENSAKVEALFEAGVTGENFRSTMCNEFQNCWEDDFSSDEITQLEGIRDKLAAHYFCEKNILKVTGVSVTTSDIINATENFYTCPFRTVFVIALHEFRIQEDVLLPSRNLVIFAPNWKSDSKHVIDLSAADFEDVEDSEDIDYMDFGYKDKPGENGGNFLGYLNNYEGDEITLTSKGGKGSKGRSSFPDIYHYALALIQNGTCVENEENFDSIWPFYAPSIGGVGGLKGEITITSLMDADLTSKIIGVVADGEHGDPGEVSETRVHCSEEIYYSYFPKEYSSFEAEHFAEPLPFQPSTASVIYQSEFQKLLTSVNRNLGVSMLDLPLNSENETEEQDKLDILIDDTMNLLSSEESAQRTDFQMNEINNYIEDLEVLSPEEKIQLSYLYAIMAVVNAKNNPFRATQMMDLENFLELTLSHVKTLTDFEEPLDLQYMEEDTLNRYLVLLDRSKKFEKHIISPVLGNYLGKLFETLILDLNDESFSKEAGEKLEVFEEIQTLIKPEIVRESSLLGLNWTKDNIFNLFMDLINHDMILRLSDSLIDDESSSLEESVEIVDSMKSKIPRLWEILVLEQILRELNLGKDSDNLELIEKELDMEIQFSAFTLENENIYNQNVTEYFPKIIWENNRSYIDFPDVWGLVNDAVHKTQTAVETLEEFVLDASLIIAMSIMDRENVVDEILDAIVRYSNRIFGRFNEVQRLLKEENAINFSETISTSELPTPVELAMITADKVLRILLSQNKIFADKIMELAENPETQRKFHSSVRRNMEDTSKILKTFGNSALKERNKYMNRKKLKDIGEVFGKVVAEDEINMAKNEPDSTLSTDETEMSLFQKLPLFRIKDSSYLSVTPKEDEEVPSELLRILTMYQKMENLRVLKKMIALRSFLNFLKIFIQNDKEQEEIYEDLLIFLIKTELEIDEENGNCFENIDLSIKPITTWQKASQKRSDDEQPSMPYACDPTTYAEVYWALHHKIQENLKLLENQDPDSKINFIIRSQNEILTFIEMAQNSRIGSKLLDKFFYFLQFAEWDRSSDFYRFFDENNYIRYFNHLQNDFWKTYFSSPSELPLNYLYNSVLEKINDLQDWASRFLFLEKDLNLLNNFAPQIRSALDMTRRTTEELKNLYAIQDVSHFLNIINENREAVNDIQSENAQQQIVKLDNVLRVDLALLCYKASKAAFNEFVFPFADTFSKYSESEKPPSGPNIPTEEVISFYGNRIKNLIRMKKNYLEIIKNAHGNVVRNQIFDPRVCHRCKPLYSWTVEEIEASGSKMNDFYNGKSVNLYADIQKSKLRLQALKGKSFGINFVPNREEDRQMINNYLRDCRIELTHTGISYSGFGGKLYVFSSPITKFYKGFSEEREILNSGYAKSKEILISPYTWWTVQLHCKQYVGLITNLVESIQLVGTAQYVTTYLKSLKPELYYPSGHSFYNNESFYLTIQ